MMFYNYRVQKNPDSSLRNMKIFVLLLGLFFHGDLLHAQTLSKSDTANVKFLNSRKFYIYKVEKGETLFNISQKFKIPQEEILQFNHEIEKEGLKAKMKIWIPAYSWLKKDSVPEKAVEVVDTRKQTYRIAIVTSLNLPRIYLSNDSSANDVMEPLNKNVKENLEFVEGVLYASELMKAEGLKAHVFIIDAESDSLKLISKLRKNSSPDLIITNETGSLLRGISRFISSTEIRLVSCSNNTIELIRGSKNSFSMIPSSGKQCELAGKFAGKYFQNPSLLLIRSPYPKENERSDLFKSGWITVQQSSVGQVEYNKNDLDQIVNKLDKKKQNVVFIPSSNEDMVTSVLSALSARIPEYQVSVIGIPTWQYFETIEQKLFETCNVYLFSSNFIDYNRDSVLTFRKYFRDKFSMEPSESSFQGFDAYVFSGKSFLMNGKKMFEENQSLTVNGLFTNYTFSHPEDGKIMENQSIHFYQPSKDVSVDLVKNFREK